MLKTGKPNFGGTQVTFVPVETVEEYQEELKKIVSDGEAIGMKFEKVKRQI